MPKNELPPCKKHELFISFGKTIGGLLEGFTVKVGRLHGPNEKHYEPKIQRAHHQPLFGRHFKITAFRFRFAAEQEKEPRQGEHDNDR